MPSRTLPNLGLKAFYDLGEDGWKGEQDLGILTLSVLTQAGAESKVSSTPGAPGDGDVHILAGDHPTNANDIAVYDVDTWKYFTPNEGWLIYNRYQDYFELFDGSDWAEFSSGGGITDAPSDGTIYGRQDGSWVEATVITASETITEAGTSANLLAANASKYQRWTGTGAKTLTVQPEATEAIPQDAEFHIANRAASDNLTIAEGTGVSVNVPSGGTLVLSPGMVATLKRVAEDGFDLIGQTVPA